MIRDERVRSVEEIVRHLQRVHSEDPGSELSFMEWTLLGEWQLDRLVKFHDDLHRMTREP